MSATRSSTTLGISYRVSAIGEPDVLWPTRSSEIVENSRSSVHTSGRKVRPSLAKPWSSTTAGPLPILSTISGRPSTSM